RPYIVMDYFSGQSLAAFLAQHGALLPQDLRYIAFHIAHAMKAAHDNGILHRDVKPDNVLVRKAGDKWQVKIIDFGLALRRQTIKTGGAARASILANTVAGTMKYAPPEQKGELPGVKQDRYSDLYAFGKLCCEALFQTTE